MQTSIAKQASQTKPAAAAEEAILTRHLNQIQLARRWSLSPRTLERWRWLRQGPAYLKLGGRIIYRVEDVEVFEAAGRRIIESTPRAAIATKPSSRGQS